jgi:hypothetical protein
VALVAGVAVGVGLVCILAAAAVVWRLKARRSKPAAGPSSGAEFFMGFEAGITPAAAFAAPAAGASAGPGGVYCIGEASAPAGGGDTTPAALAAPMNTRIGDVQAV